MESSLVLCSQKQLGVLVSARNTWKWVFLNPSADAAGTAGSLSNIFLESKGKFTGQLKSNISKISRGQTPKMANQNGKVAKKKKRLVRPDVDKGQVKGSGCGHIITTEGKAFRQ